MCIQFDIMGSRMERTMLASKRGGRNRLTLHQMVQK